MTLPMLACSLLAGWLVNLAADSLPTRRALRDTWRWPFCPLARWLPRPLRPTGVCTEDAQRPGRTLMVWAMALLLGWLATRQAGAAGAGLLLATQAWFFLAVAVIDLEHRRVLNRMLAAALPLLLMVSWIGGGPSLTSALCGALAGFGLLLIPALAWPGALGMGDVKLAGVMGLALGLAGLWVALLVGIVAGGVAALVVLLRSRRRGQTLAYAPYLVIGVWLVLFFGADWRL